MDPQHFDRLVTSWHTRRSALGLAAAFAAALGLASPDDGEAKRRKKHKCKKPCGPCRRCKKGKCKPKPGVISCGPCSECEGGACRARCPRDQCVNDGENDVCLRECDPPCDLCSSCNRISGQCESDCTAEFCTTSGCRVPCESPCDDCSFCDFGECVAACDSEQCVNGQCDVPCSPLCSPDEACLGGECFPVCEPACGDGEGCVAGSQGNECVALAGNCPANAAACFNENAIQCIANTRFGKCVKTREGASYCASGVSCSGCETDLDCENLGFGPNSRCIAECEFCFRAGGSGCVTFAGEG